MGQAGAADQGNVRQVQEALKDKGFDPGPVDGKMGRKTQEALRSFQQSKNLKATGRLDAQTRQELGIAQGSQSSGSRAMGADTGKSGAATSGSRSGTTSGTGATGSGTSGAAGGSTGTGGSSSGPSGGAR
jgi:peptidoglycan hydrolase-like protein with peptidoglycan-binding domain